MPSVSPRLSCRLDPASLPQPELIFPLEENHVQDEFPLDRERPFVAQERARREISAAFNAPLESGHCWLVGLPGSGRHTLIAIHAAGCHTAPSGAKNSEFRTAPSSANTAECANENAGASAFLMPDLHRSLSWQTVLLPNTEGQRICSLIEGGLRLLQRELSGGQTPTASVQALDEAWQDLYASPRSSVQSYANGLRARLTERLDHIASLLRGANAIYRDDLELSLRRYMWCALSRRPVAPIYSLAAVDDPEGSGAAAEALVSSVPAESAALWGQVWVNARGDGAEIAGGAVAQAAGGCVIIEGETLPDNPALWKQLRQVIKTRRIPLQFFAGSEGQAVRGEIPLRTRLFVAISPEAYLRLADSDIYLDSALSYKAEFAEDAPLTESHKREFCSYMVKRARELGGPGLAIDALASLLFYGSQQVEDSGRFSLLMGSYEPIIQRAQNLARQRQASLVKDEDIEGAIAAYRERSGLLQEELARYTEAGIIRIETQGSEVGQVNGLTVIEQPEGAFGRPQRITAAVFASKDGLVDIERECQNGGKLHSKGTQILSGYLLGSIGGLHVWPLGVSICMEQSYENVDGDSASLAEACAALSAIAAVPLEQGIAVTGSIDQFGQVQAVGGVAAKIEGFFRLCSQRGLNGKQGVIIPRANIGDLVLEREVREALRRGEFHLWAVESAAEALEILSGQPMGKLRDDRYPKRSIMGKIQAAVDETER